MRYFITKQMSASKLETRMHFSRMHTARSLTVSCSICLGGCVACHACPPPPPPACMHPCHTCPLPCMPPAMDAPHACPPHMPPCMPTCHTCPPPHMPPTIHAPHHTHPPTMYAPCHVCAPPCRPHATHTPWHICPLPPCGQTDICKNLTFANFVCGRYIANITLLFTQPMDSARHARQEQPRWGGPRTSAWRLTTETIQTCCTTL